MGREAQRDDGVARLPAIRARLPLSAQADLLAVLDALRNLDLERTAVRQDHIDLAGVRDLGQRHERAGGEILALGRRARPAAAASAARAEKFGKNVAGVEASTAAAGTSAAEVELEMFGAAGARLPPEAAGTARAKTLEAARLAVGADLAAIELAALFRVADDLVGRIDLGELLLRLGIVLVLVGMVFLGEFAEGLLDLVRARALGNTQYVVRISHIYKPIPAQPIRRRAHVLVVIWGAAPRCASREATSHTDVSPRLGQKAGKRRLS